MGFAFTFFFLVTAHYFPVDELFGLRLPHPVRLIANYVTGTVGMLLAFSLWLYNEGYLEILLMLAGYVAVAALAPLSSYALDAFLRRAALRQIEANELAELIAEHGKTNKD